MVHFSLNIPTADKVLQFVDTLSEYAVRCLLGLVLLRYHNNAEVKKVVDICLSILISETCKHKVE